MIIYKTTNLINGKIYIGKDKNNDPEYYGSGLLLNKSINKYGKENFKKEVIDICNNDNELNDKEIYWINEYQSFKREIGYNLTLGGTGGNTVLDSKKRKEIIQKRKDKYSLLSNEEMSEKFGSRKGSHTHHTDDTKAKISEKNRGEKNGMFGKTPWNKGGNCYTDEQLKRFSDSHKGQTPWNKGIPVPEEQKRHQSEKMKGRKFSEETKMKLSESLRNSEKKKSSDLKKTGTIGPNKGKKMSDEVKEKIRNKLLGKSNKTKGLIWIYNKELDKFKRTTTDKLSEYLSSGWIKLSPKSTRKI